jgi:hypothetical protein
LAQGVPKIEKNEKQLKELQTERKTARDKALEEEILLTQLAIAARESYILEENGFGFSTSEITRLAYGHLRLQKANQSQKHPQKRTTGNEGASFRNPKAA